jgi:hypothetical protein
MSISDQPLLADTAGLEPRGRRGRCGASYGPTRSASS